MKNLVITIMAAGEGKRMNSSIPKVLHLFKRTPMLVRIINESLHLNPRKIIIITGKYDELIKNTIKTYFDDFHYNNFVFVNQQNPNGTGDAINCTLDKYKDNDNVLILNGDMPLITSELLKKVVSTEMNIISMLLVAKLDNPTGYGRILYDSNNKFIGIREEKDCSIEEKKIDIVNVGIYFFRGSILKEFIPLIDNKNAQNEYYLTDIIKIIRKESDNSIETYLIEQSLKYQIMGVNTQEELRELESRELGSSTT